MPKRASRHHFMRASRWSLVSVEEDEMPVAPLLSAAQEIRIRDTKNGDHQRGDYTFHG